MRRDKGASSRGGRVYDKDAWERDGVLRLHPAERGDLDGGPSVADVKAGRHAVNLSAGSGGDPVTRELAEFLGVAVGPLVGFTFTDAARWIAAEAPAATVAAEGEGWLIASRGFRKAGGR